MTQQQTLDDFECAVKFDAYQDDSTAGVCPIQAVALTTAFTGGLFGSGYKWQDKAAWDSCYTSERFCLVFLMVIDVLFEEVSRS